MSKLTLQPNPQRVPLGRLLSVVQDALPTLTAGNIRAARYRANKAVPPRPDPHPYVIHAQGVPHPLADLAIYNEFALTKGWPLVKVEDMKGGGAR